MLNGLLGSATRPASFAYVADTSSEEKRTVKFARLESSFLIGTVAGPLIGGFLILISKETPFYVFSILGIIASLGIYKNLENKSSLTSNNIKSSQKVSWTSNTVWPFLFIASISSLCLASLIQTIGFYLFDTFSNIEDLPVVISMTFALLSISTIVSQYIFTDAFPLSNSKLLIYGILLLSFSYTVMALYPKISVYYLAIIVNGLGGGLLRPAISSSLSLAQSPEHQGSVAGYLGSVYPIGHILTPVLAMPIYAYNPAYLYYFSSILCLICFIFIITNPVFKQK
jgi:MFS family permease